MKIVGHRGASGHAPENSMEAFKLALQQGAQGIELDVHRCKTGEMIVMHDTTVDRTTNGTGEIKDLTLTEIKALQLENGEAPSTLPEVLAALKGGCRGGSNPTIYTEMKSVGGKEVARDIHHAVEQHGYEYGDLPVISFYHRQLAALHKQEPNIEIGATFPINIKGITLPELQKKVLHQIADLIGADAVNVRHDMVDEKLIEKAHGKGLKVNVWTVNEHDDIRRMVNLGVDSIMTDYPDRAKLIMQAERPHEPSATRQP